MLIVRVRGAQPRISRPSSSSSSSSSRLRTMILLEILGFFFFSRFFCLLRTNRDLLDHGGQAASDLGRRSEAELLTRP